MGRRPSVSERAILETLREIGGYCTKTQLYKKLREKGYPITTNTFFKMLKRMEVIGLIEIYGKEGRGSTHYVLLKEKNSCSNTMVETIDMSQMVKCEDLVEILEEAIINTCMYASHAYVDECLDSAVSVLKKVESKCIGYIAVNLYEDLKQKFERRLEEKRIIHHKKLKRNLWRESKKEFDEFYFYDY